MEFIKGLFKKREKGGKLSEVEEEILEGAEKVAATIEEGKKDLVSGTVGETVIKYWWVLAVVIAIVSFVFIKMRK